MTSEEKRDFLHCSIKLVNLKFVYVNTERVTGKNLSEWEQTSHYAIVRNGRECSGRPIYGNRIFLKGSYIVQIANRSMCLFPLLVVVIILIESLMNLLMVFEKGHPGEYPCPGKRK
jgi:hypothetical protein